MGCIKRNEAVKERYGTASTCISSFEDIANFLVERVQPGDLVLVAGSQSINQVAFMLVDRLKALALDDIDICSYSMRFYLMRALEMVGMYDRSEVIWDDWKEMLNQHLTTCPEDSVNMRSDCHGWSALALYEFTRCILGVRPLEPGWTKIGIEPQLLSLSDFSGSVITPKGMVQVSWKHESGRFTISGQVPDEVPVELHLPDGTKQLYLHGGSFEF